ncbi:MAG TPA: tetratricopeptide repeat protein [Myxococcaceae bacterium]|nr:tetratricopeptide repeat protein [Myxococcaceae bacterium]
MSKSLVERYEQMLGQDPTSTVFVELAKALLEKGDHPRAIEVCQTGLTHHKDSVVGRVLWGKALVNLGRPAEAMEQFDAAIGIDKENPYAYNLIGEVLLQKGLYRSALPLLRRAASLQPNDARIRGWLEQTQKALQGGPAPVVPDANDPDSLLKTAKFGTIQANGSFTPDPPPVSNEEAKGWFADASAPAAPPPPGEAPIQAQAPAPEAAPPAEPARASALLDIPPPSESVEVNLDDPPAPAPPSLTATPAPPRPPPVRPSGARAAPPGAPAPRASGQKKSLLEDIPDLAPPPKIELPKVELSTNVTKKIAEEYERELRQRVEQTAKQKGLWQKHGGKMAVSAVALVAAAVGAGGFLYTRSVHHGKDLKDALASAQKAIAQDTPQSYQQAVDALATAHEMDESSVEAWALEAYARALRVAEHGAGADERAKAQAALDRKGVADEYPGLALAARYYLAAGEEKAAAKKAVLASTSDAPEVHELSGRLLMEQKQAKQAVDQFKKALDLSSTDVRALVALGNYYREFGDCPNAVKFYETAEQVSPEHPETAVGGAECRLEMQQDLDKSLKQVESLPGDGKLPEELAARLEVVHGRLLSAAGQNDAAIKALTEGMKAYGKGHSYEFHMALGEANRARGDLEAAQKAYEAALKAHGREEAKEALGRVLLARDREKDFLARFGSDDSRKVALLRGTAYGRLGDWKKARAELGKTQQGGKYPPEAVVQLALADAAEGQEARAQEVLEKALAATKKAKSEVRVALGQVYWKQGSMDKARAQFSEALKDPLDYEGGCSLGRLLAATGHVEDALEPLEKAAARNPSHAEAQHALAQAVLQVGKLEEALQPMEAWVQDSPASPQAQLDAAEVLFRAGKLKEAEGAVTRAAKLSPSSAPAARLEAQVLYAKGDGPGAFAALQRANKLDKKDAETFCEIGWTFLRQGNGQNAAAAFSTASKNDPKSACGSVGAVLARLPGSANRAAVKELQTWAKDAPYAHDRALAKAALARVQLHLGSTKEARKDAEEAVALGPSVAQAQLALGLVAEKQKEGDKAKEALQHAVELDPTNGALYLALGDALARSDGDTAETVKAYETFLKMGGAPADTARVEKALESLKKKLAAAQ